MKTYKTFGKSHSPRLKSVDYKRISYPVHIIIGTFNRTSIFMNKQLAKIAVVEIEKFEDFIVTWCLMPDHLHLLFDPEGKERNLIETIKLIKGRISKKINELNENRRPTEVGRYGVRNRPTEVASRFSGTKNRPTEVGRYDGRYYKTSIWQESFYDHFLRKEEILEIVSLYILNNPVRKGIVDKWDKYPYSWSKYHKKNL